MIQIKAQHQRFLFFVVSAALLIFLGRLSVQYQLDARLAPIQTIPEVNPLVPLIEIEQIKDARIIGKVNKPEIRITSGDQVAIPDEFHHFELDIQHLGYIGPQRPLILHEIPQWAAFVASKKGKYYYSLDEKSAKNLSVPSRVYFATQGDAEKAGYLMRER